MQVPELSPWQPAKTTSSLQTYKFQIAGTEFQLKTGNGCRKFLDHDTDWQAIAEHEFVKPWKRRWGKVTTGGNLEFHESHVKEQAALLEKVISSKTSLLTEIAEQIISQVGTTSKFLPFEEFLDHVTRQVTTDVLVHAVAIILLSSRFKFFNNGVVVNEEGDILILDDYIGWTEPAAAFLSMADVIKKSSLHDERPVHLSLDELHSRSSSDEHTVPADFARRRYPRHPVPPRFSPVPASLAVSSHEHPVPFSYGLPKRFSYGRPTGCSYSGKADRAVIEGVSVKKRKSCSIKEHGIRRDGRFSDQSYLFFRNYKGKWRKVYMEGNLMFVSGNRGRTLTNRIPIKSLQVLGFGAEVVEGSRGLLVPTTAMFDEVVRTINKGNARLSMWFAPKVLTGRIACCRGPTVLSSYFRGKVDIPNEEFGPTLKVNLLKYGSELGFVVNVRQKSYLLAAPYDSHGFRIKKGAEGYYCVYGYVPSRDRYLVGDASKMYFGGC